MGSFKSFVLLDSTNISVLLDSTNISWKVNVGVFAKGNMGSMAVGQLG